MTNEEAIAIIRKEYLCVDRDCDIERSCGKCDLMMPTKEPILEAYNMAIKALEQEPTTKNDLGVDLISRADVLKLMKDNWHTHNGDWAMQESMDDIRALPSVTPQEPMVEIDLYSVIKQKYIEREVLDKIRAEIDNALSDGMIHKKTVLGIIDKYKAETED